MFIHVHIFVLPYRVTHYAEFIPKKARGAAIVIQNVSVIIISFLFSLSSLYWLAVN